MALELDVQKSTITSDCATMSIVDNTGDYDPVDNPTGYGSPNDARADLYLKFIATLKKTDGDEPITVPDYDPNTTNSWSIAIEEDGWYELFLFACKIYNAGTTYLADYVVYDAVTEKFYYSLQNSNTGNAVTDASWWEEATEVDHFMGAINASQTSVYYDTDNPIETCLTTKCYAKAVLADGCDCLDPCTMKVSEKIRYKLEAAQINGDIQNYSKAQEIIEQLSVICEDIGDCGCGCS